MSKQKVKVRISRQQVVVFLAIFTITAAGIGGYLVYERFYKPINTAQFEGANFAFRADLREAQQVQVTPNESVLRGMLIKPPTVREGGLVIFRPSLRNITFAFQSEGVARERMGWYSVQISEVINKMNGVYFLSFEKTLGFRAVETPDYQNLKGENTAPIVALVHPDIANGTFIHADPESKVITVSGGDSLRDFDNAVVKMLMVAMDIEA